MLTPTQVLGLFDEIAETVEDADYYEGMWRFWMHDNLVEEANMLIQLKPEGLDKYHQYRLEKHGWLWRVTRTTGDLYEATSIATGFKGTLLASYTTPLAGADDALREQASPLQEGVCGVSGQARPDQEAG